MCIIMLSVCNVLLVTLATTLAGYAGSPSNDVANGYGYGYSGSFSSGTGSGGNVGNVPIPPPFIPNFDFGNLLNGYIDSLSKYHEHFINNLQQQAQQVQQISTQGSGYAPGFSSSYSGDKASFGDGGAVAPFGGGGGDGGAVAAASIGPKGGYHTAAVYPENPNSPNIFSRFAETSQPGAGGSYSVFTSSMSSSSNVDGKPQNFHRASTTINDNGKISTYTVKNP